VDHLRSSDVLDLSRIKFLVRARASSKPILAPRVAPSQST
jgi:hypothetical protein